MVKEIDHKIAKTTHHMRQGLTSALLEQENQVSGLT